MGWHEKCEVAENFMYVNMSDRKPDSEFTDQELEDAEYVYSTMLSRVQVEVQRRKEEE